jgi:hypothetical protein
MKLNQLISFPFPQNDKTWNLLIKSSKSEDYISLAKKNFIGDCTADNRRQK